MASPGLICLLLLLLLLPLSLQTIAIQNVTRDNTDIFSNPDRKCGSNACFEYEQIRVGGSWKENCQCSCPHHNTFLVHKTTCVDRNRISSILLPGKDVSFYVTTRSTCQQSTDVFPVLDITIPPSRIYMLCLRQTPITKCKIIKKNSSYLYDGEWYPIWSEHSQQEAFNITEDNLQNSFLQWTSLGKQFTGLIFRLFISCPLQSAPNGQKFTSYLIFKSAGSHYFNGDKPTLAPMSGGNQHPTTSDKGKNSSSSDDKGLIAGLTICAILVILVIVAVVVFIHWKRKRNIEKPSSKAESKANPTYEMGPDKSLPVRVNGQTPSYDCPDTSSGYQPLVLNTRMRDASGKVPVYTPLNRGTKDDKQPVLKLQMPSDRGLAYETVAIPIQHPTASGPELDESHDYEDPTDPTIPNQGGLYAVGTAQEANTIDFENIAYKDPDSVIEIG